MSNQKKNIEELGYARHGYPEGEEIRTLKYVHDALSQLGNSVHRIFRWEQALSELLTMELTAFTALGYRCVQVSSLVTDFPEELQGIDTEAFVFTSRSDNEGLQILIGSQSGYTATRCMQAGNTGKWTFRNGSGVYYATFDIDPCTGELLMHTDPGYSGADFSLENGNITVTI